MSHREVIEPIYNYIIQHIDYDYEKINTLDHYYIPNINQVIEEKKGICYDYAVLFASMLRNQGIPTKLVKGYAKNIDSYHAWNEVYIAEENRWIIVDTTYDAVMQKTGKEYLFEKSKEEYFKKFQF